MAEADFTNTGKTRRRKAAPKHPSPTASATITVDDEAPVSRGGRAAAARPTSLAAFANEAAVELRLIVPLFEQLGFALEDISPKHPVTFQEGRRGRKHEADFVLHAGPLHTPETSLVAVEAKAPEEDMDEARRQAESYALATRAPILLICDGRVLEVWKVNLAHTSERALSIQVADIEAHRGELDLLLQKQRVIDYCEAITGKPLAKATRDFGAYEAAELRRTAAYEAVIDRRLKEANGGSERIVGSGALAGLPQGAVITAASGFGKTSLSLKLHRELIANRWSVQAGPIPVHAPLLDAAETPLLEFARQRIEAHHPGLTGDALLQLLRDQGLALLLDGFDRLPQSLRASRTGELRNLLRDYPRLQLFLFSRSSAPLALPLPLFELQPLNAEERLALLTTRGGANPDRLIYFMPPLLAELCANPLFLIRAAEHWERTGRYPERLPDLFRTWLDETIQADRLDPVRSARTEAALSDLAAAAQSGRLSATAALQALKEGGHPEEMLNELARCDAVSVAAGFVEFHHEALADYLLALRAAGLGPENLSAQLDAYDLGGGSLLPVLLMALLTTPAAQDVLWRRLSRLELGTYLEVLRYRADISNQLSGADDARRSRQFLSDLRDGVDLPLSGFLPALRPAVLDRLTGDGGAGLAIEGRVSGGSAIFSFRPRRGQAPAVQLGDALPDRFAYTVVNLAPSGLRLDSGRLLGMKRLAKAVETVVAERDLKGGVVFTDERLAARLRYLADVHSLPLHPDARLAAWEALLQPSADQIIASARTLKPLFPVSAVLSDIAFLREHGRNHLDDWWPRLQGPEALSLSDDQIGPLLREHYTRVQLIYRELAEESFGRIRAEFGFYPALPVIWLVTVRRGARGPGITEAWRPVARWEDAGAEITFTEETPGYFTREGAHYDAVHAELSRLNRERRNVTVDMSTRMYLPHMERRGDYSDWESSALRHAIDRLQRDLSDLFKRIPENDRPSSWDAE